MPTTNRPSLPRYEGRPIWPSANRQTYAQQAFDLIKGQPHVFRGRPAVFKALGFDRLGESMYFAMVNLETEGLIAKDRRGRWYPLVEDTSSIQPYSEVAWEYLLVEYSQATSPKVGRKFFKLLDFSLEDKEIEARFSDSLLASYYKQVLRLDPCSYCGGEAGYIDHIEAGGSDSWDNLTAACRDCNSHKHRIPLLPALRYIPVATAFQYARREAMLWRQNPSVKTS